MRGIYDCAPWTGKNESGIKPIGDYVLVFPDQPAMKTASGLILGSDEERERVALAAESGVVIDLADGAFKWNRDRSRPFDGDKPKVGDRVFFQRYSGVHVTGDDGVSYWLMADNCLGGFQPA